MPESEITLIIGKFISRSPTNKPQGLLHAHHVNDGATASAKATHVTLAATKLTCGKTECHTHDTTCIVRSGCPLARCSAHLCLKCAAIHAPYQLQPYCSKLFCRSRLALNIATLPLSRCPAESRKCQPARQCTSNAAFRNCYQNQMKRQLQLLRQRKRQYPAE
jgi:hypothetical protein